MKIFNDYISPLQKLGRGGVINPASSSNDIANYPFTSDYLDTVSGSAANFAVNPTITSDGIVIVGATTQASVDTTNFPVNDFSWSFRVEGFNSNPATAIITERNTLGGASINFFIARISGGIQLAMTTTAGLFSISTPSISDVTTATGYNFLVEKRTTGCRFKVDEIGGSNIVDSTDTGANAQADLDAWSSFPQGVLDLGHRRTGTIPINMNFAEFVIAPL